MECSDIANRLKGVFRDITQNELSGENVNILVVTHAFAIKYCVKKKLLIVFAVTAVVLLQVYMGNKFLALRKSEVAKAAPDRSALMGKLNQDMADMKEIREADRRWLCFLFGEPYEAEFQSEGTGSAIHVYDGNGDEILTYTAGVGWHEKESKAETEVHGALKAAYYDAFRTARQEINAGVPGMEVQGGFDARA